MLGIDIGTSRSAAAIASAGGADARTVESLEVDGNRWIASLVFLDSSGALMVGAAAEHQATLHPDRVERTPKRYLGGTAPILLGGAPVSPGAAIAKLIEVFLDEGRLRNGGAMPEAVVITHPVRWGTDRKTALEQAALEAGCPRPTLVPEPVAAAAHYAMDGIGIGDYVGVYDLGGGTFDTAVLRRTANGFESVGAPGGDEFVGGETFDHLIFAHLGALLDAEQPGSWGELQYSEERQWVRAAADLLAQSRRVKEAVSSYPASQALLPVLDREAVFTRVALEELISPHLERTVDEMAATVTSAGIGVDDLAALYLVGGSSRIPLVSRMMTTRFGDRVTTRDEPKSVVALGAALIAARLTDPALKRPPFRYVRSWGAHNGTLATAVAGGPDGLLAVSLDRLCRYDAAGGLLGTAGVPDRPTAAPGLAPGVVALGCGTAVVLYSDDLERVIWAGSVSEPVLAPPLVDQDGLVVADSGGTVTAISGSDGSVAWMLPLGGPVMAPLAAVGPVVLAAADRVLYRFDRRTGVVSWGLPVPHSIASVHTVSMTLAAVICSDGTGYGVDIATGAALWAVHLPGDGDTDTDGSGGLGSSVRVPAATPTATPTATPASVGPRTAAVSPGGVTVHDGRLYVVDGAGRLHRIDAAQGRLDWSTDGVLATPGVPGAAPSVVVAVDAIVAGAAPRAVAHLAAPNGSLVAFDAESGELLARQSVHHGAFCRPTPISQGIGIGAAERVECWRLETDTASVSDLP